MSKFENSFDTGISRSNCVEVFCRKEVLKIFTKFRGKQLSQSLFFKKVAGVRPKACNFIKKETVAQVFSCEFWEISKNTFSTEHVWATGSIIRLNNVFQEMKSLPP